MLAYVFWHRPRPGIDADAYEHALRSFQASLEVPSASFRVAELPFAASPGYEDWYLVDDWAAIGALNDAAVDAVRGEGHDRAASLTGDGWGAIYALVRGTAGIPEGIEWRDKPRGEPAARFVSSLSNETVWRRQLVLGPAPEFCGTARASAARERV